MRPEEIERLSFSIIDREAPALDLSPAEYQIARRMVHATADFDFFKQVRFHPRAVEAGLAALRAGRPVVVDTRMLAAGLTRLPAGVEVVVRLGEAETAAQAAADGRTRTAAAMRRSIEDMAGGIVAIGNAPTALLEVISLVRQGLARPALIVGLPVGFVNAAESKAELSALETPFITALGRKGGSPPAAAAVNALAVLLREAQ